MNLIDFSVQQCRLVYDNMFILRLDFKPVAECGIMMEARIVKVG